MKFSLPSQITTIQDLSDLISELKDYSAWIDHAKIKDKLKVKQLKEVFELTSNAKELVNDSSTTTDIKFVLEQLESIRTNANVMTITLATTPNHSTKSLLVDWCRKNISNDLLFSFNFNELLLGGMVLRYKSRIFDWSFRRAILENKHNFPRVLKNV